MKTIENKTKNMNKELKIIENMNKVLKELNMIEKHKYKHLIKDIIKTLSITENFKSYDIDGFMFGKYFPINISICKNVKNIYLRFYIYNQDIYRTFDAEYDLNTCLLHLNEDNIIKKVDDCLYMRIIKIIDYIDILSQKYVYSKYHDLLINKNEVKNLMKLDMDKDKFCKREIFECIVCFDYVSSNLKTTCCNKHICRMCSERIIPLKCPNCRCEFY